MGITIRFSCIEICFSVWRFRKKHDFIFDCFIIRNWVTAAASGSQSVVTATSSTAKSTSSSACSRFTRKIRGILWAQVSCSKTRTFGTANAKLLRLCLAWAWAWSCKPRLPETKMLFGGLDSSMTSSSIQLRFRRTTYHFISIHVISSRCLHTRDSSFLVCDSDIHDSLQESAHIIQSAIWLNPMSPVFIFLPRYIKS